MKESESIKIIQKITTIKKEGLNLYSVWESQNEELYSDNDYIMKCNKNDNYNINKLTLKVKNYNNQSY